MANADNCPLAVDHFVDREKPEMAGRGLLRGAREGSRNVFTVRKRAPPGGDPGNVRGAGRPVRRAGTWPRRAARRAGKAEQLVSQRGEAGQGPSISYMEGPCLILVDRNVFASTAAARRPGRTSQCEPSVAGRPRQEHRALADPYPEVTCG